MGVEPAPLTGLVNLRDGGLMGNLRAGLPNVRAGAVERDDVERGVLPMPVAMPVVPIQHEIRHDRIDSPKVRVFNLPKAADCGPIQQIVCG